MRLAVGDADEHRVAQTAERAAAFHPIGGIQHFDPVILTTAIEGGDELAGAVALQQLLEGFPLAFRERPKSPSERDRRLYVLDPLFRQLAPLTVVSRIRQIFPWLAHFPQAASGFTSGFRDTFQRVGHFVIENVRIA